MGKMMGVHVFSMFTKKSMYSHTNYVDIVGCVVYNICCIIYMCMGIVKVILDRIHVYVMMDYKWTVNGKSAIFIIMAKYYLDMYTSVSKHFGSRVAPRYVQTWLAGLSQLSQHILCTVISVTRSV